MRRLSFFAIFIGLPLASAAQDYEYRLTGPPAVADRFAGAKGRLYRVANVQANVYGGYADVITSPRPACAEGAGQKFHFAWNFDGDITELLWNKPVQVRMMIQGDSTVCSNQNPFITAEVKGLELNPVLSENSSRVFFDPRIAGRPNAGAARVIQYLKPAGGVGVGELKIVMSGFTGPGMQFEVDVSYSFKLAKVSSP